MNLVKSIRARIGSYISDYRSHYWEYIEYFESNIVNEKAILFESFGGKNFQGNPFYIFKAIFLNRQYCDYDLYIAVIEPDLIKQYLKTIGLYDERVCVIKYSSNEYRRVLSTSKYLVNNVSFNMDYIKKRQQVYLNTWHGTGLKYAGRRIKNDPFEMTNTQRNLLMCNYILAQNKFLEKVFLEDDMIDGIFSGELSVQGYPRNTVFFDSEARNQARKRYGFNGKMVILYMPTWRGTANGVDQTDFISEMDKLETRLNNNYIIYVKLHPAMKYEINALTKIRIVPNDIEINEFCNAVDILITDYSSIYTDFANSRKPIILYQYDKEQYFNNRGTYEEMQKVLPFPIVETIDELAALIKQNKSYDYKIFLDKFCKFDSINAANEAVDLLFKQPIPKKQNPVDLYVIDFPVTDEEIMRWKEQLIDQTYRFVFIPKRKNHYFQNLTCFSEIYYFVLYMFNRLTIWERVKFVFARKIYLFTHIPKLKKISEYYIKRERRRLWGETNIGQIYAKSKKMPVAVNDAVKWPL